MKNITFAGIAIAGLIATPAFAGGLNGQVADCDNASVLKTIDKRFDHAFLNKDVIAIDSITKVHQHRFEDATERSPIARRYCGAVATTSDGRERTMWYLIEDGMGLAGIGDNVEFCVSGIDKMKAYDGRCRVLK
jgi:type II secretory pathway pseudopilin PulG